MTDRYVSGYASWRRSVGASAIGVCTCSSTGKVCGSTTRSCGGSTARCGCRFASRRPQGHPRHAGADGAAARAEPALVTRLRVRHADRRPALPHPGDRRRPHARMPVPGRRHVVMPNVADVAPAQIWLDNAILRTSMAPNGLMDGLRGLQSTWQYAKGRKK
jgi:hypothetical protein